MNFALVKNGVVENIVVADSLEAATQLFSDYEVYSYSEYSYVEPGMLKGEDELGVYFWKKFRP